METLMYRWVVRLERGDVFRCYGTDEEEAYADALKKNPELHAADVLKIEKEQAVARVLKEELGYRK